MQNLTATIARPTVINGKVTTMICGCCTAPVTQISAEWATARRVLAGEVKVERKPQNRCDDCLNCNIYQAPCAPGEFTHPHCDCGCAD